MLEAYPLVLDGLGPEDEHTQTCITSLVNLYTAWDAAEPGNGYDTKADEWRGRFSDSN
jgi:hypothetical protein